jgi:protein TonB
MSGLRSLLRFDEKIAAEGRRIENLGGPPLRWVAPTALIAALSLHAAILLLPSARSASPSPPERPVPDFPRVWRLAPPAVPPSAPPAAAPSVPVPLAPDPVLQQPAAIRERRALRTEPVPEPAPEIALNTIPADIEAIIPSPDRPPPSGESGPPSRVPPPTPQDAPPALIEQVPPVYPVAARTLRAEGRVTLRLAVLPDGSVGGATVLDCTRKGLGFEAAALEAVKRWRYEPAPLQAGARKVVVRVHFQRQEERP